ncbi:hypothetical protein [Streptomyces sp. NPDC001401]|uniref:hypothetical protein n=1 Tax=Streptomyces sp. NPDC001401 TaxID=3364570 RepID=UPI0036768D7A
MFALRRARRELDRAEEAFARGDHETAAVAYEEVFTRAIRQAPTVDSDEAAVAAQALIGLGRISLRLGRSDAAQQHFGQALTLCPSDPAGLYWSGCAAAHNGYHRSADAYFTQVLARSPGEPRALVQRAYVRLLRGDPAAARSDLLAVADSELPPEARPVLALLQPWADDRAAAQGFPAEAETADDKRVLGVPHRLTGLTLELGAQTEEARQAYEREQSVYVDAALMEWHLRAAAQVLHSSARSTDLHEPDRAKRAGQHLQIARELRPKEVRVLRHLALLRHRVRDRRQAEDPPWSGPRIRPDEVRASDALGLVGRTAQDSGSEASVESAALVEAADRAGGAVPAGRAPGAFVAGPMRAADWTGAVGVLLANSGGEQQALVGETLHRGGRPLAAPSLALGPGQSPEGSGEDHRAEDPQVRSERAVPARTDRLCADLPELGGPAATLESAVVRHLGGRSGQACRDLLRIWRADPGDPRVARTVGLMLLGVLRGGGCPERAADTAWRQYIAAWGAVVESQEAWADLLADAELRYAERVPEAERREAVQALKAYVAEQLPETSPEGSPLRMLFQREARAAESLSLIGGFRLRGWMLSCGPLGLAELGACAAFGDQVASVEGALAPDEFRELLSRFSGLGLAALQAESGAYALALVTLGDLRCPGCRGRQDAGRRSATGASSPTLDEAIAAWTARDQPLLCEKSCSTFDELHPGYAGLPDRHGRLAAEAVVHAAWILLRAGVGALHQRPPDPTVAGHAWRRSVALADRTVARGDICEEIATVALGRADALQRAKDKDAAVAVLELATEVLGGRDPVERVRGRLGAALNQRGVSGANTLLADRSLAPRTAQSRLDGYLADVRRAAELNPHSALIRLNLGSLLNAQVGLAAQANDMDAVLQLQASAFEYVEVLRREFPQHRGVADLYREASRIHETLVEALRLTGRPTYRGR